MNEALEETARLLYESETGKLWAEATDEERTDWLNKASHFHAILGQTVWPTHGSDDTVH